MLDTTHLPTALSEANAPAVIDQTHPPLSNTIPQSFRALASEAPLQAAMDSLLTNFLADEDGLHFMEEGADDAEYRWICGPLIVESKAHTNSGKDWSTCIHLLDQDGKVVSLALPNSEIMCKMSAVIMQLTLLGFLITHEKKLHAVLGRLLMQWEDNRKLYGARKIWHVLRRDDEEVARCTVERLMRSLGIKGVVRGKKVVTTKPDASQPCPDDKVSRLFKADRPNQLWVSDFTYVPTWSGTVYVAFVIDVFARRIVGWRVSTSMATQFVLDALDQAIWQRKTPDNKALIHHSDRGSQYLSIKYTERLVEVGIDPSVGTVGDSYDNALAECVIGLFKAEVINQIGPWKSMREVEWETLKWVDWYNNRRLFGPIGYITPAEAEEAFYANLNTLDKVA